MADLNQKLRENLAEKGKAMPNGSYPIRNKADLKRAIQAYGRAMNKEETKKWICKRAKELDAMDLLPEGWLEDKVEHMADDLELTTIDQVEDFLAHYGVLGMKWGVRKEDRTHHPAYLARKERSAAAYDAQAERARKGIEQLDSRKPFNRAERNAIAVARAALVAKKAKAETAAKLIRKPGTRVTITAERIKREPSADHIQTREKLKKKPFELSNKDLQEVNNRLQMEKKLRELRRENTKIKQGNDHVKALLAVATTAGAAYAFTQSPLGKKLVNVGFNWLSTRLPLGAVRNLAR